MKIVFPRQIFIRIVAAIGSVLILPLPAFAQSFDSEPGKAAVSAQHEAAAIWSLMDFSFAELRKPAKHPLNTTHYASRILTTECDIDSKSNLQGEILSRTADDVANDWGLDVRGAYTNRTIEQDDDSSSAYLELSWNLLKEGYFQRNKQAETLKQKAHLATARETQSRLKRVSKCRQQQFNTLAARNQSVVLSHKLALMRKVYNIENRAYFKGWSYFDDYLVAESELKDVQQKLERLHQSGELDKFFLNNIELPLFDINLERLITSIREDQNNSSSVEIEKQIVRLENESRFNDRLRVFLRNDFDINNTPRNDGGLAYGVRFIIPLTGRKDNSIHYRLLNIDEKNQIDIWERLAHTRQAYHEFKKQLEKTEKSRYAYLRSFEKIRRAIAQHRSENEVYLPIAVKLYIRLLDNSYSFQEAKVRLYKKANNVFSLSRVIPNAEYITNVTNRDVDYRARGGERSIYVWSKEFNQISNADLFDLLQTKGIKRTIISAGKNTNKQKLQYFLEQASDHNIYIELITGSNNWIFPGNHKRASDNISLISSYSENIHLDIEPHTMSGYKQNKDKYIKHYLNLLRQIRKNNIDISLSVSVPVHWPESVYSELNLLADRVYLMAYETSSSKRIIKRIQPAIKNINHKKIVLALRTEDFDDEWAMEQTFRNIQAETGITRLGIHSLNRFIALMGSTQ